MSEIEKPSDIVSEISKDNEVDTKGLDELLIVEKENLRVKFFTDGCIKTCAWVLVTIGVCILITTIYLVVQHNINDAANKKGVNNGNYNIIDEFNKTVSRTIDDTAFASMDLTRQGCYENICKIACIKAQDLYGSLHSTLLNSACNSTEILLIENQSFPAATCKNAWIDINHPIYEVFITMSNVTKITNDAFNSPIFTNTFLLTLYKLTLHIVESGALLGLYSLKYLTIDSTISELGSAFFMPVQTTLTHLKLSSGLNFPAHKSLFGTSYLQKLEYVDLSRNFFLGPISKEMFYCTPNLKVLILTNCKITSIETDAFVNLVGKLDSLNLSKNLLTTISPQAIQPLLLANSHVSVNLGRNAWHCNCFTRPLVDLYLKLRPQFVDVLYCKAPHDLYGKYIDEVDFALLGCNDMSKTTTAIYASVEKSFENQSSQEIEPMEPQVFQMRCVSLPETHTSTESRALSRRNTISSILATELPQELDNDAGLNIAPANYLDKQVITSGNLEYIRFEPPSHELDLLLNENHSVQITISDFEPESLINIIWFSEEAESFDLTHAGDMIDYNCAAYNDPYMLVENLVPNTTYTFCMVPNNEVTVTPFSCLPLHIPLGRTRMENIWITADDKQFTVGILCVIFLLSLFAGAVIAYLGIKSYPDLLEGSKNVLVVKKSDQTCYVSTITESEYLKNSFIKKRPMGGTSQKKHSLKLPLPETPAVASLPTYNLSAKNLERLNSEKSSSTCFEDSFISASPHTDDQYEIPKIYDKSHDCDVRCVPNNYAISPASPPPLPKRNSNVYAENVSLVANRFSKSD